MNEEVTYTVLEANENPLRTVIEKKGVVVRFTIADMMTEQDEAKKYLSQWKSQLEVESAKQKNIEEYHPFVLQMSEVDLFTAHMYQESQAISKSIIPAIPEMEHQLTESETEMKKIQEELDLDLPTKDQIVDDAVSKIVDNVG